MRKVQIQESVPVYFRYPGSDNIQPTGDVLTAGSVVTLGAPIKAYDDRNNEVSAAPCIRTFYVLTKDIEKGDVQ